MELYREYLDKKRRKTADDPVKEAAKSAAIYGGLGGATHSLINGNRSLASIALRGLAGAALGGAAAGSGTYLGNALLGEPEEDDPTAYTRRIALGEGITGGATGAGLGYLMGRGAFNHVSGMPGGEKLTKLAHMAFPMDNLIMDRLKKVAAHPSKNRALALAAILGTGGAALGSFYGMGEGMGVDSFHNLSRDEEDDV